MCLLVFTPAIPSSMTLLFVVVGVWRIAIFYCLWYVPPGTVDCQQIPVGASEFCACSAGPDLPLVRHCFVLLYDRYVMKYSKCMQSPFIN